MAMLVHIPTYYAYYLSQNASLTLPLPEKLVQLLSCVITVHTSPGNFADSGWLRLVLIGPRHYAC